MIGKNWNFLKDIKKTVNMVVMAMHVGMPII